MSDVLEKTKLTFEKLGVSSEEAVDELFRELTSQADSEAKSIANEEAVEGFRIRWLGRKNSISVRLRENWLKPAPSDAKKWVGKSLNAFLQRLDDSLNNWKDSVEALEGGSQVDLSLPGVTRPIGTRHLIRQTYDELYRIFNSIGFSIIEGAEIETPYYNFEALNIPEHHPARDNMDTFYVGNAPGHLLRTHTSPMQIRTMEKQAPPVRIIVPGKVYRRDNPDATHSYMFHQVEGLAVDTDITFREFKGTVEYFVREFLGPAAKTRLRPSYFPFTEPSVEVDATCFVCLGLGCRLCKFSGWIELFGAGMVDPAVYGFVKYDAKKLSGFAFGMGVDRLAMMKYGVSELPLLY